MKNRLAGNLTLCLSLVASWPSIASADDAVIKWNENAARAATAACLHISGNGLVEARMYAMVHAAIHDAVNAIDRRSRPYAYDAEFSGPASVDAAVAAAARRTLISVIGHSAGISGVHRQRDCSHEGFVRCSADGHPRWTVENQRHCRGKSCRRRHHQAAAK